MAGTVSTSLLSVPRALPSPGEKKSSLIDEARTVAVVDQAPAGPRPVSGGPSRKPSRLPWGSSSAAARGGGERSEFSVGPPIESNPKNASGPRARRTPRTPSVPPAMPDTPSLGEGEGPWCLPTPSPPWGEGGASSLHPTNLPPELLEGGGPTGASFAKSPQRGGTSTPRPTPPPVPHLPRGGRSTRGIPDSSFVSF